MAKIIPIAKPSIDKEEISEVIKVLKSGQLAQGAWVQKFEEEFAKEFKTKYAVATSNGTTALHLSILALGLKPDDEVITTPFTFIASTNAILYGGLKPVFVDIDENTFNINPDLIEKAITKKTKAILPVHLFGLPSDMDKIIKIAKKYKLKIIEDAAQSHGAKIGKKFAGSFGDLAAFSFYPTKNMTTGEGGMITTNNKSLAEKIRILRNHGMVKRYHHQILGFNFRMTNIHAAIGLVQIKKLNTFNKTRIQNALFLNKQLSEIKKIQPPFIPKNYTHVFHQYTILVKDRDKLANYLQKNGVLTMIYYPTPVHKQPFMKKPHSNLNLPISEQVSKKVLSLPIHPSVTNQDLRKIVKLIKNYYEI